MSDTTARDQERWLPVVGYEGLYEVSDQGRVRNKHKVMCASPDSSSHLRISLRRNEVRGTHAVHRLVLEAFVGPCPEGMECCHVNDIPDDNRLENLRWATHSDNMRDSVRNGTHVWASKRHCPAGHNYTGDNLHINSNGWRECRECKRIRGKRRHQSRKGVCVLSNKNKGRDQLAQIVYDTLNGQYGDFNMPDDAADAILDAGWRPPASIVTTVEQAMDLRDGTLVVTRMGGSGYVWKGHVHATFPALYSLEWAIEHYGPLTVLWEPKEDQTDE